MVVTELEYRLSLLFLLHHKLPDTIYYQDTNQQYIDKDKHMWNKPSP